MKLPISSCCRNVFFVGCGLLLLLQTANATPTSTTIDLTTPLTFSFPANDTAVTSFFIPTFDNSLGVLMSNSATLTFDSNSWQGTYINSVTAAPSQTIVNLNVSFTADLTALSGGMPKFQKSVNLFCAGSIPCESFYIPNAPAPYIGTFRLNSIGNAVGQIRTLGGQASIAANNSVIPKTGNYIGTADISGTLRTTYTYDAKTSYQYALDAYTAALGYSDPADRIQLSREAYRQAILLRETSYFGSSQNVNIKLAEYYLRGLSGGYLTHSPSSIGTDGDALNDIPNFLGPVSAPIYNSIKSLGSLLGLVPPGWSTVGGTSDTLSGWYDGVTGKAPQDAIKNHFDGNLQRLPSAPTDGMLLPVIGVKTKILSDANDFI